MTPSEWESLLFSGIAVAIIAVLFRQNRKNAQEKIKKEFGVYLTKHLLSHRSNLSTSKVSTKKTGKTYLVTGGNGFLGSHIVEALLARGEQKIKILDMNPSPLFQNEPFVAFIKGDLRNAKEVQVACQGVDVVFHTAALINYWSNFDFDRQPSIDVNVTGTQNLIDACLANGVQQLVSTSTNSVLLDWNRYVMHNADEDTPLAQPPYVNHYVETKIMKEKLVLAANQKGKLLTAAARAGGLIWGPRDLLLMKTFAENYGGVAQGIATNETLQDYNYVENIVHGHLLLESKLNSDPDLVAGKAYFFTTNEPMRYEDFHKKAAEIFDADFKIVPHAPTIAKVLGGMQRLTNGKLPTGDARKLTSSSMWAASATLTITSKKAERDLGYKPLYNMEQSFEKLKEFVEEVLNPSE